MIKRKRKYNLNELRKNPSELETENTIEKEDISNTIRKGEQENGREFHKWDKYREYTCIVAPILSRGKIPKWMKTLLRGRYLLFHFGGL